MRRSILSRIIRPLALLFSVSALAVLMERHFGWTPPFGGSAFTALASGSHFSSDFAAMRPEEAA
ncbi:hypothetical protein [Natronohydrobacter thiooxidans]|uniref:hypothetical protein n=1 Tax=Natronohydrobacter thiooxidans TaxID=87172 RepID=UPI0008FF729B|nr:hypothetical protein [Natronohydrobacter thiooxidans]